MIDDLSKARKASGAKKSFMSELVREAIEEKYAREIKS